MDLNIGKKVIIRGDRSGVEFGTLAEHNGSEVTLFLTLRGLGRLV